MALTDVPGQLQGMALTDVPGQPQGIASTDVPGQLQGMALTDVGQQANRVEAGQPPRIAPKGNISGWLAGQPQGIAPTNAAEAIGTEHFKSGKEGRR
ncbi:MAG TPA: hypothetical protein VFB60_29370 [Ktedonobacteraceae bacterium]|nr:hypothetical protein [Ktedonobacteraceae bacterium]